MHILYLCQYFPPEMGAPAARCYEFSKRWVQSGHKVSVVAGIPNHPTGIVYNGYSKKIIHSEIIDGINVYRSWVYVTPNAGTIRRSLNYLSYAVSSIITSETIDHVDVVIASSPQFLTGISGMMVKRLKRIPLVLEIRDLWPDSIEAVDVKIPKSIMNVLRFLEHKMYSVSDHVVIVSKGFKNHLIAKGIPDERITIISNGVNASLFYPRSKCRTILNGNLKEKFIVTYVGTHGMAHGLETILKSAGDMRSIDQLHYVFVGEGACKASLKEQSKDFSNVTFFDRQSRETVSQIINESDAAIVHLKNNPLFRTVIPSKMFEIMGCGCPIILGVEGEAKNILTEAEGGICIEPENVNQLSDAIMQLYNQPSSRERYGNNATVYVNQHYNLDALATRYEDVLHSVL